jgi:hypothetical protein
LTDCYNITETPFRIFVTNGFSTNIGGLDAADELCNIEGSPLQSAGYWKAWLSTSTIDAKDRIFQSTGKYVLSNGIDDVAYGYWDLLDGTLENPINLDSGGGSVPNNNGIFIATGTNEDGTKNANTCNDWTSESSFYSGHYGDHVKSDSEWTDKDDQSCNDAYWRIYCIEQPPECRDGIDNDDDGDIDEDDTDCHTDGTLDPETYDGTINNEAGGFPFNEYRVFIAYDYSDNDPYTGWRGDTIGGVEGANQKCADNAAEFGITTNGYWKAWISNDTISPSNSFYRSPIPYKEYSTGNIIANDWGDLISDNGDGNYLRNPITTLSNGDPNPWGGSAIWTGTDSDGTSTSNNCDNWYGSSNGDIGESDNKEYYWTYSNYLECDVDYIKPYIYCFEQPFDCGNGICDIDDGEDTLTCPYDCDKGNCGNGVCESNLGEDFKTCPIDCLESRVFVSSVKYYPHELINIRGADYRCQKLAEEAGMAGTWMAWISNSTVSVADRFLHQTGRYHIANMPGIQIAQDWDDLIDGTISNTINRDENGFTVTDDYVWTGTTWQGLADEQTCKEWMFSYKNSNPYDGRAGYTLYTDSRWSEHFLRECKNKYYIYCFEQDTECGDHVCAESTGESTPGSPYYCPSDCIIAEPTGYRVFTTNSQYTGDLTNGLGDGFMGADKYCQDSADNAGLGGVWKAWLSGNSNSLNSVVARFENDDAGYANLPFYRLDHLYSPIANDWDDLTTSKGVDLQYPRAPLMVNETGGFLPMFDQAWTNTDEEGYYASASDHCELWTSSTSTDGFDGDIRKANEDWTSDYANQNCAEPRHLYCFEQPWDGAEPRIRDDYFIAFVTDQFWLA